MRKVKSERSVKKVKNSLDDFYSSWAQYPLIKEKLKKLSNKKAVKTADMLKIVIDKMYYSLRVEEKYMYYTNLYNLYEELCIYFIRHNKVMDIWEKQAYDEKIVEKVKLKYELDTITHRIGYQPAFCKKIQSKIDDSLHWLFSSLHTILKFYIGKVKNDNVTVLSAQMEKIILNSEKIYPREEEKIDKEIAYLNEILVRIKYARENVNIIYSYGMETQDKKLRTMIKSSLTRVEKLILIIIQEIENSYSDEEKIIIAA